MELPDSMELLDFLPILVMLYAFFYTVSKVSFSFLSLWEIRSYFKKYDHIIDEDELKEHLRRNKSEMPLISIISPAYNEGILIVDTVSSFLNQSYKNKE